MTASVYSTYRPLAPQTEPVKPTTPEYGPGGFGGDNNGYTPGERSADWLRYDQDLAAYNKVSGVIDPTGKPSDIAAAVTRARWEDVKNNYLPVEDDVVQQLTFMNPGMVTETVDTAMATAKKGAQGMAAARDQNIAHYGANLTAEQRDATAASDSMNQSLAMVDAANGTRTRLLDRDKEIMFGGSSAVGG